MDHAVIPRSLEVLLRPQMRNYRLRNFFIHFLVSGAPMWITSVIPRSLVKENDRYWIRTKRQKSGVASNIPLLPIPLALIRKHHPDLTAADPANSVMPVTSNQKTNRALKKIAEHCNINKELTFHIARHTFATTVTLSNGVPIESVSKMLGHRRIATTQHYAKIVDKKVEEDMRVLEGKLRFG